MIILRFDADVVVLVAGLGGETGSSFILMMARLAREAGAFTAAVGGAARGARGKFWGAVARKRR